MRSATASNFDGSGSPARSQFLPLSTCATSAFAGAYSRPNSSPSVFAACIAIGTPVTFISSNGPIPTPNAFLHAASMVGMSATPSSSSRTASFSHGTKYRLTTNPEASAEAIGVLPICSWSDHARRTASAPVRAPGTTSTRRFLAGW